MMKVERYIEILAEETQIKEVWLSQDPNILITTKSALTAIGRAVEEAVVEWMGMRNLQEANANHFRKLYENEAALNNTLRAEVERLKGLLRELMMRTQCAFPENEQDNEWFDSELKGSNPKFLIDLFDVLQLGRDIDRPPMGEG